MFMLANILGLVMLLSIEVYVLHNEKKKLYLYALWSDAHYL